MNREQLNQLTTQLDEHLENYIIVVPDTEADSCYTKLNVNCPLSVVYHMTESFTKTIHQFLDHALNEMKENKPEEYEVFVARHRHNMKIVWQDAFKPLLMDHVVGSENTGVIEQMTQKYSIN